MEVEISQESLRGLNLAGWRGVVNSTCIKSNELASAAERRYQITNNSRNQKYRGTYELSANHVANQKGRLKR